MIRKLTAGGGVSTFVASMVVLAVVSLLGGCASSQIRPGTGDIAFRLRWGGPADLDLRVEDPEGHQLSFILRECAGGGVLDVDCNSSPEEICKSPLENVFWPPGQAPEGVYRARVVFFNAHQGVTTADYTLQVLLGDVVVEQRSGTVGLDRPESEELEYRFIRGEPRSLSIGPFPAHAVAIRDSPKFQAVLEEHGYLRRCVEPAVHRYLDCGMFDHGVARVRCPDCRHEFLVAF